MIFKLSDEVSIKVCGINKEIYLIKEDKVYPLDNYMLKTLLPVDFKTESIVSNATTKRSKVSDSIQVERINNLAIALKINIIGFNCRTELSLAEYTYLLKHIDMVTSI